MKSDFVCSHCWGHAEFSLNALPMWCGGGLWRPDFKKTPNKEQKMMLGGFLTVDAGECVSRHQQKSDFYMRSNRLHALLAENILKSNFPFQIYFLAVFISFELMKTFFSTRQIKKSRQEAWTAWLPWHMMMAFFLGLAQQLWDKETGKDNHLNSMQESWGKWRIVSKDIFLLSSSFLSDTMERQNVMMSPSKFLFRRNFCIDRVSKLICMFWAVRAAVLLLQNIIWILVQVLPRALSTKTKPLREWEERSESTVICMPIQHFNDTWVQHFWKIRFYDMAKVKTKKEESLQDADATVETGWGHRGSAKAKAFSPFSLLAWVRWRFFQHSTRRFIEILIYMLFADNLCLLGLLFHSL